MNQTRFYATENRNHVIQVSLLIGGLPLLLPREEYTQLVQEHLSVKSERPAPPSTLAISVNNTTRGSSGSEAGLGSVHPDALDKRGDTLTLVEIIPCTGTLGSLLNKGCFLGVYAGFILV